MSGEGFIHSDPDRAPVAQVPQALRAMCAPEAGVVVIPPATTPAVADQNQLASHEATGTGAVPFDRWGSAPGVISDLHAEGDAR